LYKAQFGLETVESQIKDSNSMLNDLWGGNVVFAHFDPIGASSHIKAGKLRALATSAREKFNALPDIPSATEAGITNTDVIAWFSVHTPNGTPLPVREKYEKWFNDIVASDEHRQFLLPLGSDPFPGNPQVLEAILRRDIARWKEYVKLAKIEVI
jgi:tripartite-type tricarboxylate transporter receptor subunit TctC